MSIRLMSSVFENQDLGPTPKLIMLALADHADDEGHCYPSIKRLCDRTSLSERAVQSNIRDLQARGYLTVTMNAGRRGANLYIVRAAPALDAPCTSSAPAGYAPPQEMHPAGHAPLPPQEMHPPPAGDAPEPSRTTIEPLRGGGGDAREGQNDPTFRERILEAMGKPKDSRTVGSPTDMLEAGKWISDLGLTEDEVVGIVAAASAPAIARGDPPAAFRYFTKAMQRHAAAKAEGALHPATVAPRETPTIAAPAPPRIRVRAQIPEEFRE